VRTRLYAAMHKTVPAAAFVWQSVECHRLTVSFGGLNKCIALRRPVFLKARCHPGPDGCAASYHACINSTRAWGPRGVYTRDHSTCTPPSRNDIEDQFCTLSNRNGSSMANGRARLPDVLATAKLEGVVAGLVIPELREPADGPACSGAGGTAVDPP
jgi:hypothetical protein